MKAIFAIPATLALCYRAWSRKSLTPAGIFTAALTAVAHAVHPWNLPFVLLVVFFLAGTRVTAIKKNVKEKLTLRSSGSSGGEGPRTHIQVLANSGVASVLTLLHAYQLHRQSDEKSCYSCPGDLLIIGIVANYAAVAADTFSSELGILSKIEPRLITSLTLRKVPRGTNGGVTMWGLLAGLLGSMVIVTAALLCVPFCPVIPISRNGESSLLESSKAGWSIKERRYFSIGLLLWGALGSILDSLLGGWLQQSVIDTRSGRIVEGEGGRKILVSKDGLNSMHRKKRAEPKAKLLHGEGKDAIPKRLDRGDGTPDGQVEEESDSGLGSDGRYDARKISRKPSFGDGAPTRTVESGLGILDNNEVNFIMAFIMSVGAMVIASWIWDVPLQTIISL